MDWIMDIPPELTNAIIGATVVIIGSFGALIVAIVIAARKLIEAFSSLKEAQAENQRRELESDSKREEMINTFALTWEKRLEDKSLEINQLRDDLTGTKVDLAEERGKVIVLTDTLNHDRESRQRERTELNDKIAELEKRIAELEHENQSKDELITGLKKERDDLKRQLEERDKRIIELVIDVNEIKEKLKDCEDEQVDEKELVKADFKPKDDSKEDKKIS